MLALINVMFPPVVKKQSITAAIFRQFDGALKLDPVPVRNDRAAPPQLEHCYLCVPVRAMDRQHGWEGGLVRVRSRSKETMKTAKYALSLRAFSSRVHITS